MKLPLSSSFFKALTPSHIQVSVQIKLLFVTHALVQQSEWKSIVSILGDDLTFKRQFFGRATFWQAVFTDVGCPSTGTSNFF
jgi:hypothetical protein